jgi:hypothetical protein
VALTDITSFILSIVTTTTIQQLKKFNSNYYCLFLIAPSVFSNVYLHNEFNMQKHIYPLSFGLPLCDSEQY